jgi:endonuclease/exonuclease/phosphatase family metal-dependent hydrolase
MQFWPFLKQAAILPLPAASYTVARPVLQLRILSFNVRYATSSPFTNEKPWPERLPLVLNQLQHESRFLDGTAPDVPHSEAAIQHGASIICLQEVLHGQLVDIMNGLNEISASSGDGTQSPAQGPIWAHVGVGRDDGSTKGEYSPILYPAKLFRMLHFETVWLSPTPEKPSKGWDAGSIRILTVAVLEHKPTGQRVLASTTHLDNAGSESRAHSVAIILSTLKRKQETWSRSGALPVFLAGDFNSFPDQEAYLGMSHSDYVYDLRDVVPPKRRYNDQITFTGFEPDTDKDKDEKGRIDFIWLGPRDAVSSSNKADESLSNSTNTSKELLWIVDGYAVLPNVYDDGVYLSDHRCVVGDIRLLLQGS